MNYASSDSSGLNNGLLEEFEFIRVKFLPYNTIPLLQLIDKQVISDFEQHYTTELFKWFFEEIEETNLIPWEFQKKIRYIVNCLKIINKTWDWITKRTSVLFWENFNLIAFLDRTLGCLLVNNSDQVLMKLYLGENHEIEGEWGQHSRAGRVIWPGNDHWWVMDLYHEQQQEVMEGGLRRRKRQRDPSLQRRLERCLEFRRIQTFARKYHPTVTVQAMIV